jgi:metallophosphoesterase superfamily enzyme
MRAHEDWLLTPQRVAVHLPTATAVVSDLHLGYDAARRRSGEAIPEVCLETLLEPLGRALAIHSVHRLVIAGDLFEAAYDAELAMQLLRWLTGQGVELAAVIPGNHDRGMLEGSGTLPLFAEGYCVGGWQVVHGDGKLPRTPVIHGHFHPCLRLDRIMSPCFLIGPRRILLPAYSTDARGVNVLGVAAWQKLRCCIPVGSGVLDFGVVRYLRRGRNAV